MQGLQLQRQAAEGQAGEREALLQEVSSRREVQRGGGQRVQRQVQLRPQVVPMLEQHIQLLSGGQELVPRSLGQS